MKHGDSSESIVDLPFLELLSYSLAKHCKNQTIFGGIMSDSSNNATGAFVVIGVGVAIGGFVAVGSYLRSGTDPYIGCDFSDRGEAATRRDLGILPRDAVYEACKKAVDNFFDKKLDQYAGKIVINLPSREELVRSKASATPLAAAPR